MKNKRLYLLIVVVGLLLSWRYCGADSAATRDGQGMEHLLDRPWITKVPASPKERYHALIFLTEDRIGASVNGSAYQHLVTVLRHQVKGSELTLEVLQLGKRFTTSGHTYECDGPEGLDLCLDLGPRLKQVRFYSSSEWKVGEEETPTFGLAVEELEPVAEGLELETLEASEGLSLLLR